MMSALPLTSPDARRAAEPAAPSPAVTQPAASQPAPAQPAGGPRYEPCVLLKLGEIVLKGKNRQQFERLLHDNIRRALKDVGVQLWQREGVIVLRVAGGQAADPAAAEATADLVAERMRNMMGLSRVCRAVRVAKEPEAAIEGRGGADRRAPRLVRGPGPAP